MNSGPGAMLPPDALPPKRATFGGRMSRTRCFQEGSLSKRGKRKKVWVARWWEDAIGTRLPDATDSSFGNSRIGRGNPN